MPTNYKVLGQSAPSATTNTTLYTVPASTQAVVSTITICNRGTSQGSYRLAIRPDGAAIANQHYLAFDATVPAATTITWTIGATLGDTDVITVFASSADFSFAAFGSEITP